MLNPPVLLYRRLCCKTPPLGLIKPFYAQSSCLAPQTFELLDAVTGAHLKEVDFGPHYFGEVLHRSIILFNNGPIDAKYLLT